jgi:hypothetical protein
MCLLFVLTSWVDLLEEPDSSIPQLVTQATNWSSAYEAMRAHAGHQISANPKWGGTTELNTNNLYEILNYRRHVVLRYEMDAIYPTGEDADGATTWTRMDDLTPPNVHYGMYVDLHRDDKHKSESFFIGGFTNLSEATFSMKQSAGAFLSQHKGFALYATRLDLLDEKGKFAQRYSVKKGSRNEHGAFVADEEWNMDWDAVRNGRPLAMDRKPSVLSLDSHTAAHPPPLPQIAQKNAPETKPPVLATATPKAEPARITRRQSQQPTPDVAPEVAATAQAQLPPAKSTRRQSRLAASSGPDLEQDEVEPKVEPEPAATPAPKKSKAKSANVWCTCRLPDDGSFMIGCDNHDCPIEWYHGRCVDIHRALPEGTEWYCALCTTERENKNGKSKAKTPPKTPAKTPKKGGGRGGGGVGGSAVKAKGKSWGRKSGV